MSRDFVFLTTISWDDAGGAHRPARFALELARQGHRVLYIEVQASHEPPSHPNIDVVPLPEFGLTERAARYAWFGQEPEGLEAVTAQFARKLNAFSSNAADPAVAIWYAPYILFVRFWPLFQKGNYIKVYDVLDDFDGLRQAGFFFSSVESERFLLERCDLTLIGSMSLAEKLAECAPGVYPQLLRSGLDPSLLSPTTDGKPPPLQRSYCPPWRLEPRMRVPGRRQKAAGQGGGDKQASAALLRGDRTLGFWGTIADWTIDVEALEYVARARPNWAINLIGAVDPEPGRPLVRPRLEALPNVRLHGQVAHSRLPSYLSGFDVCLIPFSKNVFNAGREPIKTYEYLAGLKPVVALNTPQLQGMPAVYLASNAHEFLEQIECAVTTPLNREAIAQYLAASSWKARTERLLNLISETKPSNRSPVTELPGFYPEPDLPQNWRLYIKQLDRLLEERGAYARQMEREWANTQVYLNKLERTHPLLPLLRAMKRGK